MSARLFVAVVPPARVIASLDAFLEPRRDAAPDLNWTLPQSWHLTCAFLPAVPEGSFDDLVSALEQVARRTSSFALEVGGAGAFPNPSRAKALWLGVPKGEVELRQLARRCRNAIGRCSQVVERERVHPHLTLARTKPISARRWLTVLDALPQQGWTVTDFELIRSSGLRGGAGYQRVAQFPLATLE